MRILAAAVVLGTLSSACGAEEETRARFELRPVVAPRIAALERELGPEAPAPEPDPDTVERVRGLVDGLPGTDARMRRIFADEVKQIGEPALPVLAACLAETDASDARRLAAVQLAGEIDTPRAADWLALQVESAPQAWVRANAAFQLSRSSQDHVVPRLLLRLKYELDGETVIWTATALGHFRNWAGLDGLGVLASTGATEEIRASAAERLAALAQEAGVDPGRRLASADPSPRHRLAVWRFIERLARQDLRSVDDARFVLARCSDWAVEPLTEALHEETAYIRTHAAQCLQRMGRRAAGAGPALVEALDEPRLAPTAAAALGSIGWPPAAEALARRLDARVDPEVRNAAAHALGALGDPAAIEPLRRILAADEPLDLRQAAAGSLVALGRGDEAVPLLLECLKSGRADASAAEASLGSWLSGRASAGDEAARSVLERWNALAPAPGTTPSPDQAAARHRDRAGLLEASSILEER